MPSAPALHAQVLGAIPVALPKLPLSPLHLVPTPSFHIPSVLYHKPFNSSCSPISIFKCASWGDPPYLLSSSYLLFLGQQLHGRWVTAGWELLICWLVSGLSPLSGPRSCPEQGWVSFSTGTGNLSSTQVASSSSPEEQSQTAYTSFSPAINEATKEGVFH